VLLHLRTYLPERVSLFNPTGTTETVYIFKDLDTNERGMLERLFAGDPFRPGTFGYKAEVHAPPPQKPIPMPMLIGASSKEALEVQKALKSRGFDLQFKKGSSTPSREKLYHIESQDPPPDTPLQPGQKIVLRYYDMERIANQRPEN
jgi:PASTA domain